MPLLSTPASILPSVWGQLVPASPAVDALVFFCCSLCMCVFIFVLVSLYCIPVSCWSAAMLQADVPATLFHIMG